MKFKSAWRLIMPALADAAASGNDTRSANPRPRPVVMLCNRFPPQACRSATCCGSTTSLQSPSTRACVTLGGEHMGHRFILLCLASNERPAAALPARGLLESLTIRRATYICFACAVPLRFAVLPEGYSRPQIDAFSCIQGAGTGDKGQLVGRRQPGGGGVCRGRRHRHPLPQ